MTHIQRLPPETLSTTSRKQAAQQTLVESIDALIDEANDALEPTAVSDVTVPDCPLARKVAASTHAALNVETQALP